MSNTASALQYPENLQTVLNHERALSLNRPYNRLSNLLHLFCSVTKNVVSVVQRLTAWVSGVPVLQLVTENSGSNISQSKLPVPRSTASSSKSRKRRADSLEDDEMYAKLRKGDPYVLNTRQEQELSQLKEGKMCGNITSFIYRCCGKEFLKGLSTESLR